MLEDLIMAATNEAMRKIDEASQQSMSQLSLIHIFVKKSAM